MEGGEFEKSNYGKLKFLGSAPGGGLETRVGMLNHIKLKNFKEVLLIPFIPFLYKIHFVMYCSQWFVPGGLVGVCTLA